MIRTRLRYHRPSTPAETSALLAEHHGNVAVLGGGTQLLPRLTRDEVRVEHLVDLRALDLDTITVNGDQADIGAMVTYADVLSSPELGDMVPLLAQVAAGITGGRQLTQQGTLVGSACENYPGTDIPGALVALRARMRLHGIDGVREVSAADFFLGSSTVDVRRGEFVESFFVRRTPRGSYSKVRHCTSSWPIATASAVLDPATGAMSVTLGAVQATPVRIPVEDPAALPELVQAAVTEPWSDLLAPGSYRAAVAGVVARRAVAELLETPS
jgi:carbon-monoxide dehydrogenase medium subunit